MKSGSDNFRQSASIDVLKLVKELGATALIYELSIQDQTAFGYRVLNDFEAFASKCDVIMANRWDDALAPVRIHDIGVGTAHVALTASDMVCTQRRAYFPS